MEFSKKMNKSGGLTLPAAMRRELGLQGGERFGINVNNDGSITLKRVQGNCVFCRADRDLIVYQGRFICSTCADNITSATRRG